MWIKTAHVTLTVLPPIPTAGLSREERKELGSAIRDVYKRQVLRRAAKRTGRNFSPACWMGSLPVRPYAL